MAKKVPTRAVPSPLSAEARNFVMQAQQPEIVRPSVPPPPPPAAEPVRVEVPAAAVTAAEPKAPAPAPRGRKRSNRTLISRADGRTLRRLQIYLDADVARRLKHHCIDHDVDMSAYVNDVLAKALR